MGDEVKNLNQQILNFDYEQNFKDKDFYVSKSNQYSFKLLNNWPKWEKNFINLIGERFSGKTHLINIFLKKFKGLKINANEINNQSLNEIKITSVKEINKTSKDSKGQVSSYRTIIRLNVIIKNENKVLKEKSFVKDFSYNKKDNKFDLAEYQKEIEISLVNEIIEELTIYLNL